MSVHKFKPLLASFFLVLVGCSASREKAVILVETGVIFSEEQAKILAKDPMSELQTPFWRPTTEDIVKLEARLKIYLAQHSNSDAQKISKNLQDYKRQYVGFYVNAQRIIFVNAFCGDVWRVGNSWQHHFEFNLDGGACFFRVRYDRESSDFFGFEVNGEA